MKSNFDPKSNLNDTMNRIGYTPRRQTSKEAYEALGFMCGLEVHQQLKTDKKLFCNCPAGVFQKEGQFDAEVIRHMRPTLSEMGGYDGTALMEFKTRKTVVYRISNVTTCTYDVDDTPPFKINRQALKIAVEIALLLKTNIVGELHITRKQYLDGSIPTGFQRTGIISIEGEIPIKNKTVRIIQLSLEEDSCREVSDIGHTRIYTTDRLGMPLIETVTYPDMKNPDEAYEAAQYIRFLNRSSDKVRTGIGSTREDVNVSIAGGTRVEIKGVSRISLIPELVHNEAFRQKSLLEIQKELLSKNQTKENWRISYSYIDILNLNSSENEELHALVAKNTEFESKKYRLVAVNLPGFKGILSFFNQPGRTFSDEISDRLKVIACIEKPNMIHSEDLDINNAAAIFAKVSKQLNSSFNDSQILFWGSEEDISTALETIEDRCRMAFEGVPSETRKAFSDGTTMFERVLPGADRMYPDTDSAPISISQEFIDAIKANLPASVNYRMTQLKKWEVPKDAYPYLLRNNLMPLVERIHEELGYTPKFTALLLAHRLKYLQGHIQPDSYFDFEKIYEAMSFVKTQNICNELLYDILKVAYKHPKMDMVSILSSIDFIKLTREDIYSLVPFLKEKFKTIRTSNNEDAELKWIMKELRKKASGNIPLKLLSEVVRKGGIMA